MLGSSVNDTPAVMPTFPVQCQLSLLLRAFPRTLVRSFQSLDYSWPNEGSSALHEPLREAFADPESVDLARGAVAQPLSSSDEEIDLEHKSK
jgi:hypothetical protein